LERAKSLEAAKNARRSFSWQAVRQRQTRQTMNTGA